MITGIRPPAVADSFYPAPPFHLKKMMEDFLAHVPPSATRDSPKAIIAPHAGYIYSGPIAASAYACLRHHSSKQAIQRVVILGPAHRYPVFGLAAPESRFFSTPLGNLAVDHAVLEKIVAFFPLVKFAEVAHQQEHSVEVQLPFLQLLLGNHFQILPLVVGQVAPESVAPILEYCWGGSETLIVISSDLSHYHDYATAQKMDQKTAHAITTLDPDAIDFDDACGGIGIRALLMVAQKKKLRARCIDLRNSGDTAGDKNQVVGYGAFHFE